MPNKIEDPIKRLIRQQQQEEADVSSFTQGRYAKQRDVGDPSFNYQGPMGYAGSGTKDRMPGTTPYRRPSPLEDLASRLMELLKIKKQPPKLRTIKSKDRDVI